MFQKFMRLIMTPQNCFRITKTQKFNRYSDRVQDIFIPEQLHMFCGIIPVWINICTVDKIQYTPHSFTYEGVAQDIVDARRTYEEHHKYPTQKYIISSSDKIPMMEDMVKWK